MSQERILSARRNKRDTSRIHDKRTFDIMPRSGMHWNGWATLKMNFVSARFVWHLWQSAVSLSLVERIDQRLFANTPNYWLAKVSNTHASHDSSGPLNFDLGTRSPLKFRAWGRDSHFVVKNTFGSTKWYYLQNGGVKKSTTNHEIPTKCSARGNCMSLCRNMKMHRIYRMMGPPREFKNNIIL